MIDDNPKDYKWEDIIPVVREAYETEFGESPDDDFPDCVLICKGHKLWRGKNTVGELVEAILNWCADSLLRRGTKHVKRDDPIGFVQYMHDADIEDIAKKKARRKARQHEW
jgi:hypothetical protein